MAHIDDKPTKRPRVVWMSGPLCNEGGVMVGYSNGQRISFHPNEPIKWRPNDDFGSGKIWRKPLVSPRHEGQ